MNGLPQNWFTGIELGSTDFDIDLDERCEFSELEASNPIIAARSNWVWGKQIAIAWCPFSGRQMYLPSAALLNGLIIEGRSGTRKSTGVIDPLVAQLIALGIGRKVLFLSYKPSLLSVANVGIECERAGVRFRYLTTVPGDLSYGVPLLHTVKRRLPSAMDAATFLLMAMGLDFGQGYGQTYFFEVKRRVMAYIMASNQLEEQGWNFANLARFFATCEPPAEYTEEFEKSRTELVSLLFILAACDAINCLPGDDRAMIDLSKFFLSERREVLYVQAAKEQNPAISFLVPQLIMAIAAEAFSVLPDTSQIRLVVVVDEAAEFFSEYVSKMVQRLRSKGVAFVFAYQHPGQLKQNQRDFTADFESYAATKIYLSVEDKDRAELYRYFAGEELRVTGVNYPVESNPDPIGGNLWPVQYLPDQYYGTKIRDREEVVDSRALPRTVSVGTRPRLSVNDVFSLFAKQGFGLIRSSADRELWQQSGLMIPAFFPFHISTRERDRREKLSWPSTPGTSPVVFTDEFARFVRDSVREAPTLTQGSTWAKITKHGRK